MLIKQVNILKKELQTIDSLVTGDIFEMFDNMSLCVTQKDDEVKQLTKKVESLQIH